MKEDDKAPFTSHLEELRSRLIISFSAVGVAFIVAYFFKDKLFELLMKPLTDVMGEGEKLIFTNLPEAFFVYLKTAFLAAVLAASPVILYQFWKFVGPGLYKKERQVLLPVVFLCSFFFIGGSLFGYYVVFPFGFQFFLGFATEFIKPLPSMKEYFSFASKMLIAFGVVFELPLIITLFARLGLVSVDFLKKNRKYAVLLFFTVAAILTPPDVVSQIMMAIPLMVLYEISIIGARIFARKNPYEDEIGEEDSPGEKDSAGEGK
jgi:sec-independent protein translocase protein TatC